MRMLALCSWSFDLDSCDIGTVVGRLMVIFTSFWHFFCARKLFVEQWVTYSMCKEVHVCVGFLQGKLNKLCVDSGLLRCVSRKKNVVSFNLNKNKKEKEIERGKKKLKKITKAQKIYLHLPYSAMLFVKTKTELIKTMKL